MRRAMPNSPHKEGNRANGAPEVQIQNQQRHFAVDDGHGKALATLKAQAALCGCSLVELADGSFLICRWDYSRAVPGLREVGDLLRQIGGRV